MSRTHRHRSQWYSSDYSNVENYIKAYYSDENRYNSGYRSIKERSKWWPYTTREEVVKEFNKGTRDGKSWRCGGNKLLREMSNDCKRSLNRKHIKMIKDDPETYENMIPSCEKHTKHFAWCVW